MPTYYRTSTPLYRLQAHAATDAAYFAEGVNRVVLDAEIGWPTTVPSASAQFWVSPSESGNDWLDPYSLANVALGTNERPLMKIADAGPNGHPVYTTGIIDLGAYTGVVRWRVRLIVADQDAAAVPTIYEVRVRKTQAVTDNENPPRYYWLRNDVPDEAHTLSLDVMRTVNVDLMETADLHQLSVTDPTDAATVQSDSRPVVNPSDLVLLEVNATHNAVTTQENMAALDSAPLPALSVTTAGLSEAALAYGSANGRPNVLMTVTAQGAAGARWLRKKTDATWSGLKGDFDVALRLTSVFGAPPPAIGYGSQQAGLFLYVATDPMNPWDGTVADYVKAYVSDDGQVHLETRLGNAGVVKTAVLRRESNPNQSASGILRLIRNGSTVSVFYHPTTSSDALLNGGAMLVTQLELPSDLHLSVFTDGATQSPSVTTHQLSLTDAVANPLPAGLAFFVSHDDGHTWTQVSPGVAAYLGKTGTQLRWRLDVAANQSASLDLRHLALSAWAYRAADFGTLDAVSDKMKNAGAGTYTTYLYWKYLDKNDTLLFFDDVLRESTPLEALIAKVEITLDADKQVTAQRITNYKNKVYLSEQGILLHANHVLETDVDADGFFTETHTQVVSVTDQKESGRFAVRLEQPMQTVNGVLLPVDGKVTLSWNGTPYLIGGSSSYTWAQLAAATPKEIVDPAAGKFTFQVGPEQPATLPRQDIVRVIDSRPGTAGIQEQVWLNWGRRPTVVTVFDGHPATTVIQNTLGHAGFTANKQGGMVLPDGQVSAGFWRAETQW